MSKRGVGEEKNHMEMAGEKTVFSYFLGLSK